MAKNFTCDRCKSTINQFNVWLVETSNENETIGQRRFASEIHLCQKCYSELDYWINSEALDK